MRKQDLCVLAANLAKRTGNFVTMALAVGLLGGVLPMSPPPALARVPTQSEVETALTCQCGCGLTVHSCNHLNCGSAIPLKKEIGEQISAGRSLPEIERYFESKYGEKILSAPTTRGFNLIAWVLPFALIGSGVIVGGVVLWRWRREGPAEPTDPTGSAGPTEDANLSELREKLERELRSRDT